MASLVSYNIILGLMFMSCVKGHVSQSDKTYVIDLDAAPATRWVQVGKDHPQIGAVMKHVIESVVPKEVVPLLEKFVQQMDRYLPPEYIEELQGLANATGAPIGDFVVNNLVYDITAHCTSIVSQDRHGHIWHARNFDYDFTQDLRNITIFVEFQRNKKTVYRAATFAGYIGVFTGEKVNAYTMSIDERDKGTPRWMNAMVALLYNNASSVFVASRKVFDSAESYVEAVEQFSHIVLLAPMYIIVGGAHPGEGVVITRDRTYTEDLWLLDPFNGRWFLVETNYDHWLPAPKSDDRRDFAIALMNKMGQKHISTTKLLDILLSPHVSQNTTVFSTIFSASQPDVYFTYIWK